MAKIKSVSRKVQSLERLEDLWRTKFLEIAKEVTSYRYELQDRLKEVIPDGHEVGIIGLGKNGREYTFFVQIRIKEDHRVKGVRYTNLSGLNDGVIKVLRDAEKELGIHIAYGIPQGPPSVKLNHYTY